jgi:branched-chain amino acid transport system substrate-binding protein
MKTKFQHLGKTATKVASILATALLCAGNAGAQQAQDTFKVAIIMPFSGAYGIVGQMARRGIEVALEERGNKVLGKPVEVMWEDDEANPQVGVRKANAAIANGAQVILGSVASPVTLALMRLAAQNKVLLFTSSSSDDRITGADKNRYTFRTSNSVGMENRIIAEYIASSGMKSIYGIGMDANVSRDSWANLEKTMKNLGVKSAGVSFNPVGTADFSVVIDKIAKSDAQGVVTYTSGGDSVSFVKQALSVNLPQKVKIVGNTFDETTAAAIGPASIGIQTSTRYNAALDTPRNKAFVAAFQKKFGEVPSVFSGTHYDGMSWVLDVVDSTKSWNTEMWVDAFEGNVRENTIQGRKVMRKCDHQAAADGLWAEIVANPANPAKPQLLVIKRFPADKLLDPCPAG